ncbi:hypothetical protein ACH42_13280 [Endozoicomonas sp. (ex Bugula neritina AB1)]|nr:hypothetical protein ACH42_13280 [Endozoicomonas sp. (ex Bugula neritina AB1)]
MHITYDITGQAQNRINQLMIKHSPRYSLLIWLASFSCLIIPMAIFGRILSSITLSGLFGSAFITFCILKLALRYATHKRYSLHYQPDLQLETRTLSLKDDEFCISSSLLRPASRSYSHIKDIKVEDNIIIIIGKSWWFELIPRDCITEGNGGLLLAELSEKTGVKLK